MKKTVLICVLALLAAVVPAGAGEPTTMKGEFLWNNENRTGALEAKFTPTGEGTWDVVFHFTWEDQPHAWAGTASGSLLDGELRGEVMSDGERQQPFVFEGSFTNGTFNGTHGSMRDGERRDLGTLTLGH